MKNEEKILNLLTIMQGDINSLKTDVTSMKGDIKGIKSQLDENTQMIHSLIEASKINKAEHDNFNHQLARLSGEMRRGFDEFKEMQTSLLEMYGKHEAEIRVLRRNPVYHDCIDSKL